MTNDSKSPSFPPPCSPLKQAPREFWIKIGNFNEYASVLDAKPGNDKDYIHVIEVIKNEQGAKK